MSEVDSKQWTKSEGKLLVIELTMLALRRIEAPPPLVLPKEAPAPRRP